MSLRWLLIALLVSLSPFASAAAPVQLRMGLGLENRFAPEVNPDFLEMSQAPVLFQEVRFHPWTILAEFSMEKKTTASGGFEVRHRAIGTTLWGRYALGTDDRALPYLTAGAGLYRDHVGQFFNGAVEERSGSRWQTGAGIGWERVLWRFLVVEAEGRATLVQNRRNPQLSVLVRAGVQF